MDEQKSENNLEGSSFLGFDSRFLGKCHQKAVKSRILNYVYFCRFQTLSMPTKPSHSKCLRLSFWKPGRHSKFHLSHIIIIRRASSVYAGSCKQNPMHVGADLLFHRICFCTFRPFAKILNSQPNHFETNAVSYTEAEGLFFQCSFGRAEPNALLLHSPAQNSLARFHTV